MHDVQIEQVRGRGMVMVRARAEVAADLAAAAQVPAPGVRRFETAGQRSLAWMSPDERLLFLPEAEVAGAVAALDHALAGHPALVEDVTDARDLFRLKGRAAREVLAKGAPVDLSRGAFGPGDFRRTRIGQIAAAFWQVEADPETFELMCFRSVGAHMRAWLDSASAPGTLPGIL